MLKVRYQLAYSVTMPDGEERELSEEQPLIILEGRGELVHYLLPGPFTESGVKALNVAVKELIAGGQWFQLWRGDIIGLHTPETDGGKRGGVHRGSLVHQEA